MSDLRCAIDELFLPRDAMHKKPKCGKNSDFWTYTLTRIWCAEDVRLHASRRHRSGHPHQVDSRSCYGPLYIGLTQIAAVFIHSSVVVMLMKPSQGYSLQGWYEKLVSKVEFLG